MINQKWSTWTFVMAAAFIAFMQGAAAQGRLLGNDNVAPAESLPQPSSGRDARPVVPSPIAGKNPQVITQAGVGGGVAYGRTGVVEVGGSLAFSGNRSQNNLMVTPAVGWFLTNNFEVSLLLQWMRSQQSSQELSSNNVSGFIEPSLHIPFADYGFAFGGLGLGGTYASSDEAGFALAPRLGLNLLIGRSGILTPSVGWNTVFSNNVKTDDNNNTLVALRNLWSVNVGYSVML